MFELLFELLIFTFPQTTGREVLYVLTFGKVSCDDIMAEVIGVIFWIAFWILFGVWWGFA